jgi:NitT/TauT family transport system substrate-binding protein
MVFMKIRALTSLLAVLFLVVACSPVPASTALEATSASPARPEVLHLEVPDDPDISDLPRLMAFDALKEQGYVIEPVSLAETTLVTVAMIQGDLDFAVISNVDAWLSIEEGAPLITILDETAITRYLVVNENIQQCSDLNGQRLGIASLKGTATIYLYEYIKVHCPATVPSYLVLSGSGNRLVSLQAGELDAAMLDLTDYIELKNESQSTAYPMVIFANEFPGLTTTSFIARREFAEQYPEAVKDLIRNVLIARRQLQDPEVLANELVTRMGIDAIAAPAIARTFIDDHVWDVNGGYTIDKLQDNIDFLHDTAGVDLTLSASEISDLSYLSAVLDEIGRK